VGHISAVLLAYLLILKAAYCMLAQAQPGVREPLVINGINHLEASSLQVVISRRKITMKMREDLKPGNKFPNFELPDQDGETLQLSQRMRGWPIIVVFYRGVW
jgi:cytochrome oxidase Cu insertion factor (SCO1/SenC/PrrC family)